MMIRIRRAAERGHAEHGWLHSHHSFSFANYFDRNHMGHSALRVINDDTVEGGGGFGEHPHRDMEIISYVLQGEMEHRDSMGNGSVIRRGEVQRMSAGTGVRHSEFNVSKQQQMRFLQIWIEPDRSGYTPGYEQRAFADDLLHNRFHCVAAGDGRADAVKINQDARLYIGRFNDGVGQFTIDSGRCGYVHLALGALTMNGETMREGDGAYIDGATTLTFTEARQAEVLLFDLPDPK